MSLRTIAIVATLATGPVALAGCGDDDGDRASVPTASVSPARPTTTLAEATTSSASPSAPVDLTALQIELTTVAEVDSPTAMVPRAGTDDLYVAERAGVVRRLVASGDAFSVHPQPVVDITDLVADLGGERGLLGLTFSPDGSDLFMSYTDGDDDGASVVAAYPMDGDVAASSARQEILRLPQPYPNHNGGNIAFGPDGYLYIGFGDGGSQGDPDDNGQDTGSLLGKLLRVDVAASTTDGGYTVPADNPYVGVDGARNEIWASGLRNPWRFSFDRVTGDLWIADVGGSAYEEIDHLPATDGGGRGANLGWSLREGAHDTDKAGDRSTSFVDPIFEYGHDEGASITGGFVYRGSRVPGLVGAYLFSDFAAAELRALTVRDGALAQQAVLTTTGDRMSQVSSFAEDADGDVYVLNLSGEILRLS